MKARRRDLALELVRRYLGPAPGPIMVVDGEGGELLFRVPCPLAFADGAGAYWRWDPIDPTMLLSGWR